VPVHRLYGPAVRRGLLCAAPLLALWLLRDWLPAAGTSGLVTIALVVAAMALYGSVYLLFDIRERGIVTALPGALRQVARLRAP